MEINCRMKSAGDKMPGTLLLWQLMSNTIQLEMAGFETEFCGCANSD